MSQVAVEKIPLRASIDLSSNIWIIQCIFCRFTFQSDSSYHFVDMTHMTIDNESIDHDISNIRNVSIDCESIRHESVNLFAGLLQDSFYYSHALDTTHFTTKDESIHLDFSRINHDTNYRELPASDPIRLLRHNGRYSFLSPKPGPSKIVIPVAPIEPIRYLKPRYCVPDKPARISRVNRINSCHFNSRII